MYGNMQSFKLGKCTYIVIANLRGLNIELMNTHCKSFVCCGKVKLCGYLNPFMCLINIIVNGPMHFTQPFLRFEP